MNVLPAPATILFKPTSDAANGAVRMAEVEAIETTRFQLETVGRSLVSNSITLIALAWALTPTRASWVIPLWCALALLVKYVTVTHAWWAQRLPLTFARARHATRVQCALHIIYGITLGSICWISVTPVHYENAALTVFLCAGLASGAVSYLAPNYPVYFCLINSLLWTAMPYFLWIGGKPYYFLVMGGIALYMVLRSAAKANQQTILNFVRARYENAELLEQLRDESDNARQARLEAEQANQAKSRFLASASHDLRQPTHALGLFLDALQQTRLDDVQQDILCKARTVFDSSASMLNALLDYSRIEAGAITPQPRAMTLQSLLSTLEDEFAARANDKDLVYRTRETQLVVHTDPLVLAMILRNLISNAIRYTQDGGVLVGCRRRGHSAVIEVWDSGVGIPMPQQDEIFSEFTQLSNPERDHRKGLGLGLAIAAGFARLLGTRIEVESRPGHGSVFRIRLPLSRELPETDSMDPASIAIPPGLQVLIVDDEEFVRAGMVSALTRWHCRTRAVETITEALAVIDEWAPDMIICDYRLRDGQTGAELISAVRGSSIVGLPCILITGDTAPERIREAMAIGVPLLHKPVSAKELLQTMSRLLPPAAH